MTKAMLRKQKAKLIAYSDFNLDESIKMAVKIKDLDKFEYALKLAEEIENEVVLKLFITAACNKNLLESKYYKETLNIIARETNIQILPGIVNILCNKTLTNSECQKVVLNLLDKYKDETEHILTVAKNLIIMNKLKIEPLVFRKLMNLNKYLINRLAATINNSYMNKERISRIINTIVLNCSNISIIESNLIALINAFEKIAATKSKEASDTLLLLISTQIYNKKEQKISLPLPDKVIVTNGENQKTIQLKK